MLQYICPVAIQNTEKYIKVPEQGGHRDVTPTTANISFEFLQYTVHLQLNVIIIMKRYWDKYKDCGIVRKHQRVVTFQGFLIQKMHKTNKREILFTKP